MEQARIYLSPPDVGEEEEKRALRAIRSGWVAPIGPDLETFETVIADLAGREFAVAVSSGTAALHLGLLALGVKRGDYVICSTLTFVATANAISYVGAIPVFVDSDVISGNISVSLLEEAIRSLESRGKNVGAVIPVDFLGKVANYEELLVLCLKFGIPVLSDAAESVGSTRAGKPAGSFGDASIFSFNGNKIVTTSGGGAFLTDNADHAHTVRHLATQAREKERHYEHAVLGYNYRMSNVLAAIGLAQLERLDYMVSKRRRNRSMYRSLFDGVAGVNVMGDSDREDNCWLTAILIESSLAGFSSTELADFLDDANIESRPIWKPMHMQPLYEKADCFVDGSAETLFSQGIALPSGSGLSQDDWQRISQTIKSFLLARRRNLMATRE